MFSILLKSIFFNFLVNSLKVLNFEQLNELNTHNNRQTYIAVRYI